jgi:hypothetical protein
VRTKNTFRIYCGKEFNSFEAEDNPVLFRIIQLLRQKALDKEGLAEDRMLGANEIKIFNCLESRGGPYAEFYNKQVYKPYISKYVKRGANTEKYRVPQMIKRDYVSLADEKKMTDNKYKRISFTSLIREVVRGCCQYIQQRTCGGSSKRHQTKRWL